jgi:hypothetical protein
MKDYFSEEIGIKPKKDYFSEEVLNKPIIKSTFSDNINQKSAQLSFEGKPVQSFFSGLAGDIHSELIGPATHAASALAFDVPRTSSKIQENMGVPGATEAREVLFPEQRTMLGKSLRAGLEVPATLLGGAGKLAANVFKKTAPLAAKGILGKIAQGSLSGATYGATQTKPTVEEYAKSLADTTIGGGVLPMAGQVIAKAAPVVKGFGRYVVSKGAGISKSTIDAVDKMGFQKIRDVAKKGVGYIQEDVIPRAKEAILNNITKAGDTSRGLLNEMGFRPDQIDDIMKISKDSMKKYGKVLSKGWDTASVKIQQAEREIGKKIGAVYDSAQKAGGKVNIKNTMYAIKKQLSSFGLIDQNGQLLPDAATHPSTALRNLTKIWAEYAPNVGTGELQVPAYKNLMSRVEASIVKLTEDQKFNIPLYKVRKVLANDAIESLAQKGSPFEKEWRLLNKEYTDLKLLEDLSGKVTKVAETLPQRIMAQRKNLTDKHLRLYGKDIVKDIDAYNAARELYPEKETLGLFNMQKPLIRSAYMAGEATKEAVKPFVSSVGRSIAGMANKYADEPALSPKTKAFFAQAPN